jgi:tetratricopeptide (TPR) repeat protein
MDLMTLATVLLVAVGLLGADAVMYSNSVVVEVVAPSKIDKMVFDPAMLEDEFDDQMFAIARVESVVKRPDIRASRDQGLGMALAQEANLKSLAYALQSELGYKPDKLKLYLYVEDGTLRGLVSGTSYRVGSFRQIMTPMKDEELVPFVRRCALWGASELAPYLTALYLLQKHSADKNFAGVISLVEHTKGELSPAPLSFDRSALDNLLGIVALFENETLSARTTFEQAVTEYPANTVAVLNAAFADVQLNDYGKAAERMQHLVADAPPANKVLLATAYLTWGAAQMGLRDIDGADKLLAKATTIDPESSTAWELWSEAKALKGDTVAAADLRRKALMTTATFENYAEVAALYFRLSWKGNEPVIRNDFAPPAVVTLH